GRARAALLERRRRATDDGTRAGPEGRPRPRAGADDLHAAGGDVRRRDQHGGRHPRRTRGGGDGTRAERLRPQRPDLRTRRPLGNGHAEEPEEGGGSTRGAARRARRRRQREPRRDASPARPRRGVRARVATLVVGVVELAVVVVAMERRRQVPLGRHGRAGPGDRARGDLALHPAPSAGFSYACAGGKMPGTASAPVISRTLTTSAARNRAPSDATRTLARAARVP